MPGMPEQEAQSGRLGELVDEFRLVFAGRSGWIDSLVPPLAFLILNAVLNFEIALWGSLGLAGLFVLFRLAKRQPLRFALGGFGGVILAVAVATLIGRAEGYFLPGILWGVVTVIVCLLSVLVKRPLVAWTSYITRRWPLEWYWHPRVRPAYSEVTLAWAFFFAARTSMQYLLFQRGATGTLRVVQILTGWPAIILLLVASYLYGLWRLQNAAGPSVEEYKAGAEPPWQGQQRGF